MACQDIIVVVDKAETVAARLTVAAILAKRFGARVSGLYATGFPLGLASGDIVGSTALIEAFIAAQRDEASKTETAFRAELTRLRLAGEWLYREADATPGVVPVARVYDLVIVGQPDPDGLATPLLRPEEVVLAVGRPVLVVPYTGGVSEIGRRVVVAWNGAREAARALHDAMFLLERADSVTVLEVDAAD